MGGMCSRQDPARIIIQGLDAAGKTTLLYRLKLGEVVTTIPTIGFNVESIKSSTGLTVTAWDLGGRDKIRPLYRHYYNNTAGIIYVVDSSDTERLDFALEELDRWVLHEDELKDCVVMLLANKQDLGNALSAEAIEDRLQAYHKFWKKDLSVSLFVMPCSARADVAKEMHQAFDFFVSMIKMKQEGNLRNRFYPRAWESANQEADSEKATANDVTMFHRLKTSVFKNPFQLMKSFLFY